MGDEADDPTKAWPVWPSESPSGWSDEWPDQRRGWQAQGWESKAAVGCSVVFLMLGLVVLAFMVFMAFALRSWGSNK